MILLVLVLLVLLVLVLLMLMHLVHLHLVLLVLVLLYEPVLLLPILLRVRRMRPIILLRLRLRTVLVPAQRPTKPERPVVQRALSGPLAALSFPVPVPLPVAQRAATAPSGERDEGTGSAVRRGDGRCAAEELDRTRGARPDDAHCAQRVEAAREAELGLGVGWVDGDWVCCDGLRRVGLG